MMTTTTLEQHSSLKEVTRRFGWAGAFAAIAAFYALTLPANHTEAIDGYDYAYRAEHFPLTHIDDTRSILFNLINKLLYHTSESLGLGMRSMPIILCLEVLAGAGAVLLIVRLLRKGFGLSPLAAWLGGAFLGLSYGFWRYTGEPEVYVPSTFLILATLNMLCNALADERARWPAVIPAAVLAGLTTLYYQPNAIPVFLAIPALLLSRRTFSWLIIYGAVGSAIVIGGLIAAYAVENGPSITLQKLIEFAGNRSGEFPSDPFTLKTALMMGQAIIHDVVSTNWLFGIDTIVSQLKSGLAGRDLEPKIFAAEHFEPYYYLAIPFLVIFAATLARMMWVAGKGLPRTPFSRWVLFGLVWFGLESLIIVWLDPTSREPWIMVLPTLSILFAVFIFEPVARQGMRNTLALFICALLLVNFFGGMGLIQSEAGDYQYARSLWLRHNASPNDAVLFGEQDNNRRMKIYLHYVLNIPIVTYPPTKVFSINESMAQEMFLDKIFTDLRQKNGRLYVLSQFFVEDWKNLNRTWNHDMRISRAKSFMERVRNHAQLVHTGPLGAIYEIKPVRP